MLLATVSNGPAFSTCSTVLPDVWFQPSCAWDVTWYLTTLFENQGLNIYSLRLMWLHLDLEGSNDDSLCLLAICSWCFSLASFILAESLAYSAASSLLLVHCFFRAACQRLCSRTCGVILDALVLCLFSLFEGFLTTYWWTWFLERLKNF